MTDFSLQKCKKSNATNNVEFFFCPNVVIWTVNKHNSVWYDIANVLNNKLSLATNVIILTPTTCFGLQDHNQVVLGS
jgi:hypothetical protein